MKEKIWIAAAIALMVVGCSRDFIVRSSMQEGNCVCEVIVEETVMEKGLVPPPPLPIKSLMKR